MLPGHAGKRVAGGPALTLPHTHRLPAPLRVLIGTQFGLYYAGHGLSLVGIWMQRMACGWLVWNWTHSAFWLGILSAGDLLPVILVGPFAGVAADRWDRLRQNKLAQIALASVALMMAVLLATGHLGLVGLVALTTAQGTLTAVIQPARLAMVHQMVRREDLGTAVALNSVNINLARLLGPAAAGAMILHMDIAWVFVVNAVANFAFVLVLHRLRLEPCERRHRALSFLGAMTEGFGHILRSQPLWLILLVMLCGGSMVRAIVELTPAIAAQAFSRDAMGLAVLTSATAFGAVVSGLTVGTSRPVRLLYGVLLWWGASALAAIMLAQAQTPLMAIIAGVAVGATVTRGLVSTQTFVQMATPDDLRGRVLSVHGLVARASPALGALVIGFAADRIGLTRAVAASSGALILSLLVLVPLARSAAQKVEGTA